MLISGCFGIFFGITARSDVELINFHGKERTLSDVERAARVFDALSSETRIVLGLALLEGPKRLNELARQLGSDPSNLRKMLLDMERAGLVYRREGVWHATPLLASTLSSVSPERKARGRKVPNYYIFLPSMFIFMLAAVQAVLQEKPTYLLGGAVLAALTALLAYALARRGMEKP